MLLCDMSRMLLCDMSRMIFEPVQDVIYKYMSRSILRHVTDVLCDMSRMLYRNVSRIILEPVKDVIYHCISRSIFRHVTDVSLWHVTNIVLCRVTDDFRTCQGCYIPLHVTDYITTCHGSDLTTCHGSFWLYFLPVTDDFWTYQGCYLCLHRQCTSRSISRHVTDFTCRDSSRIIIGTSQGCL